MKPDQSFALVLATVALALALRPLTSFAGLADTMEVIKQSQLSR